MPLSEAGSKTKRHLKSSLPEKFLQQADRLPVPLVVFVATMLIYGATAAPDLTVAFHSGDGGELITAVFTGGIPHPPGYPTYLLLGKLAALLPLEPIAYRFSLFSAFCGAMAAALTSAAGRSLGLNGWTLALPGFVMAFSPLVWQQAVITEVYALNLLLVALFIWSLLGKRPSWQVGILLGLCLTTHLTSVLLLPLALLLVPANQWPRLGFGLLFGLTPYLLLPLLARPDSPVVWGPPNTITGWWWLVSARIYQPNQLALPAEKLGLRLIEWGKLGLRQLLFVGWLLLPWSGWQDENKKEWFGLLATAVSYLIYAFFYNTSDALVFSLPAWLLLSLSLAAVFKRVGSWGIVLPIVLVLLNFSQIDGLEHHQVRPFAEQLLNSSPADAILITSGDPDVFALWYFHFVEKQRSDVMIVDDQLFAFEWYRDRLKSLYPELQGVAVDDLPAFRSLNAGTRPICTVVLLEEGNLISSILCTESTITTIRRGQIVMRPDS